MPDRCLAFNQSNILGLSVYDPVSASRGVEVLRIFHESSTIYDLIITDMTMPHRAGLELSREILAIRTDIPIILFTGFNGMIIEQKARKQGSKEFFMKPIFLMNWPAL